MQCGLTSFWGGAGGGGGERSLVIPVFEFFLGGGRVFLHLTREGNGLWVMGIGMGYAQA